MKLRAQVSLFLLIFGLAPLLVAVAINVPLVYDRLEFFYNELYLQKLRLDFRDLDQHLSRRQEMVRLFAKTPEPGLGTRQTGKEISFLRTDYTNWVNRSLYNDNDIIEITFIKRDESIAYRLHRNHKSGILEPATGNPSLPEARFLKAGLDLKPGAVLISAITFNRDTKILDSQHFMNLHFISPVLGISRATNLPETIGAVIFTIDVGGLASAYKGLYWVQNNGDYLSYNEEQKPASTAFLDFPGLQKIFAKGDVALWKYTDKQIFWVPLFTTRNSGPLWVGRIVDPSPLIAFRTTLETRVIIIITGLLLVIFLIARFIALRTEQIGRELTDGISTMLEKDSEVSFSWKRPEELRTLGKNLTRLAETHAQAARTLRSHAEEMAESNRYKSEFLTNISHELRTPLNSILLLSKMLASSEEKTFSSKNKQQARIINATGNDLRVLIDTILDLSKIEAGKASTNKDTLLLPVFLHDIIELMQPQFDDKKLELELQIDEKLPHTLNTDAEKLRQILINFLSNAVKFTPQGKTTLTLSSNTGEDAETRPVRISVQDTGIGIPADKQNSIFEAFKQVDGSITRRFGGTGLGLTISRELAQLLGGRIELHSTESIGTTFSLLLPVDLEHGKTTSAQHQETTTASGIHDQNDVTSLIPDAHYPGKRILLVDDDLRNLLALTPLLEKWGIEVTAAGDGNEALETLAEDSDFNLILMDLMMPDMDGYEAIRTVRADDHLADMIIVALTAKAGSDDRAEAIAIGANDYLAKPVEPDTLKSILDQYLGESDDQQEQE